MATGDLTTLAAVKEWLGETDASDALLGRLISVASTAIQNHLNRPSLAPTAYVTALDGAGGATIVTKCYPITDVTSVTINDIAIPLDLVVWDSTSISLKCGTFSRGRGNVRITYTAGQTIPPDVGQACLLTVQAMVSSMDIDPNLASESSGGGSFSYRETPGGIPATARALLAQYRRVF
jgi:hypothetical protein